MKENKFMHKVNICYFAGQDSLSQCLPCDGGMYCPHYGMASPFSNCSERYYCNASAITATPTDGITGKI